MSDVQVLNEPNILDSSKMVCKEGKPEPSWFTVDSVWWFFSKGTQMGSDVTNGKELDVQGTLRRKLRECVCV